MWKKKRKDKAKPGSKMESLGERGHGPGFLIRTSLYAEKNSYNYYKCYLILGQRFVYAVYLMSRFQLRKSSVTNNSEVFIINCKSQAVDVTGTLREADGFYKRLILA